MSMIFNTSESLISPRIAIIGMGFSGTLAFANMVAKATTSFVVELFEEGESLSNGIAYGTSEPAHLLNVRAINMGAFSGKPEGFYEWLQTAEGKTGVSKLCPTLEIKPESYLPRALYGIYLKQILDSTLVSAKEKNIEVHTHSSRVVDAVIHDPETQQIMLSLAKGGMIKEVLVDTIVLATGNLPPRRFGFQPGLIRGVEHYVSDVWQPAKDNLFPGKVSQLSAESEIVIIGTGLTMVDTVLTLKRQGYKGTITAISRHGWLPAIHSHVKAYPQWEWTKDPAQIPRTAFGMFRRLRQEAENALAEGYDWRAVIDSLRPVTQAIWKNIPINEKRKFLNRLFTVWNIHRHRMAPDIHGEIKAMQQSGTLKVLAGKIYYVGSDEQGLTIAYRKRGANRIETIRAELVLNCTGPEYDIAASTHRLLKNMRDNELITIGPLRIGIDINKTGAARGRASDAIFPLGSLLVGELLECTAVPELREQAAQAAANVLKRISQLKEKGRKENLLMGAWI